MDSDIAPTVTAREPRDSHPAIVITGAASGIGREIARLAAMEGSFLLLVDHACQELADFVGELAAFDVKAAAVCLDLTHSDAVSSIERALRERELHCDVLVNCAGLPLFGSATNTPDQDQMSQIDVNVRALTELSIRFLPGMLARGGGGVLNLGSITGNAPVPNMAIYYASKAFVNSFSAALASELSGTGVTVTCLAPGLVMTPSFEQSKAAQSWLIPQSDAFDAATAGWLGFKAGKRLVIPGVRNQSVVTVAKLLPQSVVLQLVGLLQRTR
jgi:short-subunit dehydrogenase